MLPILGAVARFGLQTMRFSAEGSRSPLNGFLVGVLLGFDSVGAVGVQATYRVQIDGRNFDFAVTAGRLAGAGHEPDVTLSASASDLVTARLGSTATQRLAALRRLRFHGNHDDVDTMRTVLRLRNDPPATANPCAYMYRRQYLSLLPHCAIPMSCTDEDGGVVPIRRTTREARWRTFVQPS